MIQGKLLPTVETDCHSQKILTVGELVSGSDSQRTETQRCFGRTFF